MKKERKECESREGRMYALFKWGKIKLVYSSRANETLRLG